MIAVEVEVRHSTSGIVLLVTRQDGRLPTIRQCEEAGEDHGLFDPLITTSVAQVGTRMVKAGQRMVTEGYTGELCEHKWGHWGHYGRNPYGTFNTCTKCGVKVMTATPQRGTRITFTYDGIWVLREHIWLRWITQGPVAGALLPQPHHQKGAARE